MARRSLPQAPTKSRRLATQQEAAEKFQVSDRTIRAWISAGRISGYRLPNGRGVRVDLAEIESLMERIPTVVAK
jgi:excisionase family DNA binding protein